MSIQWEDILAAQYRGAIVKPRTLVDVGAHRAVHTAQFLGMGAARVVAFEPIPQLASGLREMSTRYPCLVVHSVALSNVSGRSSFVVNRDALAESGLRPRSDHVAPDVLKIEVELASLDQFEIENVDFIKIDAEGAELSVLAGSGETIGRSRPLLSVEYGWAGYHSYGHEKRSLLDWADEHAYHVCDLFGYCLSAGTYDACVDRYYWDFFLVPQERSDLLKRLAVNGRRLLSRIDTFVAGAT